MANREPHLLLVEPCADLTEMFVSALARRFDAQITCVHDAASALDADVDLPHDVVITELDLGDYSGVQLVEQLSSLGSRPVVMMGEEPLAEDVIEALHLGVRDFLSKPFAIAELLDAVERALHGADIRRAQQARYRNMRELVRRVIRERRELNQRVDLLCRDLVGAHRRLVHRVLAMEQTPAANPH